MLFTGAAMAQRAGDEPGQDASNQHVTVGGHVFGGGNLAPVEGNTYVKINQPGCTIGSVGGTGVHSGGDVYGGGALADVGTDSDNTTTVDILDGTINGNVYGGGLGKLVPGVDTISAKVYGKVYVNIGTKEDNTLIGNASFSVSDDLGYGNVFGCNNICGTPLDNVFVNIYKTAHTTGDNNNSYPSGITNMEQLHGAPNTYINYAIKAVYGGGNMASYEPEANTAGNPNKCATVHVWDCEENTVQTIYGGGNAADAGTASKPADTRLIIDGGRFDRIFGGGNGYSASHNHTLAYYDGSQCSSAVSQERCPDYNPGANIFGTASTFINGGLYRQVFGGSNQYGDIGRVALTIQKNCDYLLIEECFGGGNEAVISSDVETTLLCSFDEVDDYHIGNFYGGSNMADIRGNVTLNVHGGTYTNVFGGSKGVKDDDPTNNVPANIVDNPDTDDVVEGNVTLNLYGGTMVNAFGGSDANGNISGNITVNLLQQGDCPLVIDTIYGGGRDASYTPSPVAGKKIVSPVVNLWNGQVGETNNANAVTVAGCVFGGGKGSGAVVTAHPKVNIGDIEHDGNSYQVKVLGHVFGGGNAAEVDGIDSVLMLKANSEVVNLFGGGNKAAADTAVVMMTVAAQVDTIFGGGNLAGLAGTAWVEVSSGTARGGVYGGSNKSGTVADNIVVNVTGGTVGATNRAANIHGGGYGKDTETQGHVTVNFGTISNTHSEYPKVYGDIYGGSALGEVNDASNGVDTTAVNILNGEVKKTTSGTITGGNIYGGGLGRKRLDETPGILAKVNGKVYVNVGSIDDDSNLHGKAVIDGSVFGCNNLNGSPLDSVFVNIYATHHGSTPAYNAYPTTGITSIDDLASNSESQTYAIQAVYGGGNEAGYTPQLTEDNKPKSTTVHVYGCQENTIKDVYGGGNAADVGSNGTNGIAANTFVIVDGGRINRVFGGGKGVAGGVAANIYGTATTTVYAGLIDSIFGGSNQNGAISTANLILASATSSTCADKLYNQVFGGANVAAIAAPLSTTINCGVGTIGDIYGGSNLADITNDVVLNIQGGHFTNVFGGSKGAQDKPANISGNVELNLNGGEMVNAFGGSNVNGNIGGSITVNVLDTVADCQLQVDTIYGAGQDASYTPNRVAGKKIVSPVVNLWHGQVGETNNANAVTVAGCVFGGGKGSGAVVTAHPKVNIGDIEHDANKITVLGHVFGGGNAASVDGIDSVLMLKANSEVVNLFGGGNKAEADSTVVMMTVAAQVDTIFGGGNLAGLSGAALVEVTAGTARGGVYGGSNKSGTVAGNIVVNLIGGTVGTDADHTANVHGGGYGSSTSTSGNVEVNIAQANAATGPTVWGDVYGGSALGNVNGAGHSTTVTLNKGTLNGDLYGGGLGDGSHAALVNGAVQVTVNGGTVTGSVYGCNNANGSPQGTVRVDIYGTDTPATGYALGHVFGGGNQAAYNGTPVVNVHNCDNSIEYVYGGGNAANVTGTNVTIYGGNSIAHVFGGCYGANVTTNGTDVKIYGGTIDTIYGGNNESGTIAGDIRVTVNKTADTDPNGSSTACDLHIQEVYGGGNKAASNAGQITIRCTGTGPTEGIGYVYGGANRANVTGPIVLNIEEGRVGNVFGGNNNSGSITGAITVNIEKKEEPCVWEVGNVFGGGNLAIYAGTPVVNIKNGTVANVYGGGNGDPTSPTQEPGQVNGTNVTIGDATEGYCAVVTGNVYGGGNAAKVSGNTLVTYNDSHASSAVDNIFGGGNQAGVTGTSTVSMSNGTVASGVYGGCNTSGTINGLITVNITGGTLGSQTNLEQSVTADVFGGGYGSSTSASNNVEVNIGNATSGPTIYGDVYGGSALGSVNTGAGNTTTVNILNGTLRTYRTSATENNQTIYFYTGGNVFGGGLGETNDNTKGIVNGEIVVNIGSGTPDATHPDIVLPTGVTGKATIQGNVYGCNNTYGSPQQNVTVNIFQTAHTPDDSATYLNPENIPTELKFAIPNVFGGGNNAPFSTMGKTAKVNIYGCGNTIERVFGGGNAAAAPHVNTLIQGGRMYQVFGGGNGERGAAFGADITAGIDLNIHGGNVGQFYGASNQNGSINGAINVNVDNNGPCPSDLIIDEFFCGGNFADIDGDLETTISCSDGMTVNNLYGGCNQANITGHVVLNLEGGTYINVYGGSKGDLASLGSGHIDKQANIGGYVTLNLHGGTIENVFGGSNVNGNINGVITVNVLDKELECPLNITNIYGGSNMTSYTPGYSPSTGSERITPIVNVVHALHGIAGNVYGGSKGLVGTPATVNSSPLVNIGYEAGMMNLPATYNPAAYSRKTTIQGSVFGGCDAAVVEGNTEIRLNKGAKVIENVYGGGNMGEVNGDTKVIINGKRQ